MRMTVSKIEPSRHVKGRILVYLDSGDMLKATEQEALTFSLYSGRVLSAEELRALRAAAEMIGVRALSKKELCRRLIQKGESEEDACAAADWLEEIGALDDLRYAKSVVRHYAGLRYGPAKMRDELYRRGVPRGLWDEAIASECSESTEAIDAYIRSRLRAAPLDDKMRRRLCDALRRRGFQWEDIKSALRRLDAEDWEEE